MSHIFISYSKKNQPYARRLAAYLLEHGFDIWIDDRIEYGDNWWRAVVRAIQTSAACVVVMTPDSEQSRWVEREVALAEKQGKYMFPLLLAGENWPLFVLTQYVDVTDGALPGPDFIERLAAVVPSRESHGSNVAEIPADKPAPYHPTPGLDTYAAISEFFRQREASEFDTALDLLDQIQSSENVPGSFDCDMFRHDILEAIERRDAAQHQREWEAAAEREYAIIQLLAQHDAKRVPAALENFWLTYKNYDPDNLADRYRPTPAITQEQRRLLDIMLEAQRPPPERAEAGRQLAEIGDPRPGVGLRADDLPDIDWVEIPAGEFIYQDGERLTLPTFYIARYPVTFVQFQAFLDAPDGFERDEWWKGLTPPGYQKQEMAEQASKFRNHPRENVSWYQAVAFCRWLSAKLGYEVMLPTEQQWEKAARGTDGREYPWGNEYISGYANIDETDPNVTVGPYYIRQTTAAGIYPQGASPYGVLDLSGNVWEWCLNTFDGDTGLGSEAGRVLRGGSWSRDRYRARTVSRYRSSPPDWDDDIGLRVVCSAPTP